MGSSIDISTLFGTNTGSTNGANDISSLFGTVTGTSSNNNSSSSLGVSLTDYASIKNGSYAKLMKKYYSKDTTTKDVDIEAYKSKQKLVAGKASDVAGKLNDLMDKTYTEDNREDITKDIESFVEKYNTMMESADKSNSKNIIKTAGWLQDLVADNSRLLGNIGISVDSDGKLEINKDTLAKADMDSLKEVFGYNPTGFSSKLLYKSEQIYSLAATYGTSATAYTSSGSFNRNYSSANTDSSINTTT